MSLLKDIESAYPGINFTLTKNEYNDDILAFNTPYGYKLIPLIDLTIVQLKRIVGRSINPDTLLCEICSETKEQNVTCRCSNTYCVDCYINIIRSGSGIFTCPYCRYTFGNRYINVDKCIDMIKSTITKLPQQ